MDVSDVLDPMDVGQILRVPVLTSTTHPLSRVQTPFRVMVMNSLVALLARIHLNVGHPDGVLI